MVSLSKVAIALGGCLLLAVALGFFLTRLSAKRAGGHGLFPAFFLALTCVYALGFAARYLLVEVLP